MGYKFIILTILGLTNSIFGQESAASPAQIAYAISQNYDQTGPGLVQQGTTTQNTPSYNQQTLSSLQQTQPQIFTQQQYVQPQQYTQQYVQPQQYVQQTVPMTLYHQQNAQSLFGRFQASHSQPQVSYTHVQVQPNTQHQSQQPQYVAYTQPQVRFTQPQYTQQTKAVPQYTFDIHNAIANEAAKGRQNEAVFGFNHFSQTNAQHGGFTPIVIQPKAQEPSYVVPEGKSTYTSPVVVRAVYQPANKPVLGAPLAKFTAPLQHQYRFAQ